MPPNAAEQNLIRVPRPAISIELGLMAALLGLVMISGVTALSASVNTSFEPAPEQLRSTY